MIKILFRLFLANLFIVTLVIILFASVNLYGSKATSIYALPNGTFTVLNTNDSGSGSLRQAMLDAENYDSITFDPSLANQTIFLQSTLIVDKRLTITSTIPITISGDSNGDGFGNIRVFLVQSDSSIFLENLTIADGKESNDDCTYNCGGGLKVKTSGSATIRNCTFKNNVVSVIGWGGAIYNDGSLYIYDSTFINNLAEGRGGGIFNEGVMQVYDSLFIDNEGEDGEGGAIFNYYSGTSLIFDSYFIRNSSGKGGGISSWGPIYIWDTTFDGNYASNDGGGIAHFGYNVSLAIQNSTLSNNVSGYDGGGISNSGNLKLYNSTLSGNSASQTGGAISTYYGVLEFYNSTISGNSASRTGGGGGIYSNYGRYAWRNTIISNNVNGDCVTNNGIPADNINNLIEDGSCGAYISGDPMLGPLADNGGETLTHALLPGSPAIDAGDAFTCRSVDQRYFVRPVDGDGDGISTCDIGAYEYDPLATPMPTHTPSPTSTPTHTPSPTSTPTSTPTATATTTASATASATATATPQNTEWKIYVPLVFKW